MLQRPLLSDFSSGELSPKMNGRVDEVAFKGAQTLENVFTIPQGGVTKRPGTVWISETQDNAAARLMTYVYSPTESYLVEMINGKIRLYRNGNAVVNATNPAWDGTTMWEVGVAADFRGIYFVHRDWAPVALIRSATDTFSWGAINYTFHTGASYTSHNTSNLVGDDELDITTSIASVAQQGILRVWHATGAFDEYTYTSWSGSKFSGVSPTLRRTYDNGDTIRVSHEYHSDNATAPFAAASNYPGALAIAYGRFWFASSTRDRQRIWACKAYGDIVDSNSLYLDMRTEQIIVTTREEQKDSSTWAVADEPETETVTYTRAIITDAEAIQIDIASNMGDSINWMEYGHSLHVGTTGAEWVIPKEISARNPRADLQTRMGSADDVFPQFAWDVLLFPQSSKKQLRAYKYSEEAQQYKPPDLTLRADHVLGTGAVQIAFQTEPRNMVYVPRADGEMPVLVYEPDAGVLAWCRWVSTAATFTSVAVVPESGVDVVYVVVKRGSNYDVEKFSDPFPAAQNDIIFMDGTYDATTDADGLWVVDTLTLVWLASRTVTIVVDGAVSTTKAANGSGEIDMTGISGTQVWVGEAYTAKVQTMPIVGAPDEAGTQVMQDTRVVNVNLRVYRTLEAKVAFNTWTVADAEAYVFGATWETDDIEIQFDGEQDPNADIRIVSDTPLPMTILAISPEITT